MGESRRTLAVAGVVVLGAMLSIVAVGFAIIAVKLERPEPIDLVRAWDQPDPAVVVERVSTVVPFPRGLAIVDGDLYALSRGRVREYGGVDPGLDDMAGTLWIVDPDLAEPWDGDGSIAGTNGRVFAEPTDPPFRLLDRSLPRALDDGKTDRPYCALRFDPLTQSFYICAFSGIDMGARPWFRKNDADALLRFDLRTGRWHEVERHDASAGWEYPHADPATTPPPPPPHGLLKGPDNLLVVGRWLFAVAKDNSVLARYDLAPLASDPEAIPHGEVVLGNEVTIAGQPMRIEGHSMLAERDGWLYVGFRTSSQVIRLPIDDGGEIDASRAQLLALFDPWDGDHSANLTDMSICPEGDVYIVSAYPARIYRFTPDPARVYDFRDDEGRGAWVDLASWTQNPQMKAENVLVDDQGRVFVTSGDAYGHDEGLGGAIWRISAIEQ